MIPTYIFVRFGHHKEEVRMASCKEEYEGGTYVFIFFLPMDAPPIHIIRVLTKVQPRVQGMGIPPVIHILLPFKIYIHKHTHTHKHTQTYTYTDTYT